MTIDPAANWSSECTRHVIDAAKTLLCYGQPFVSNSTNLSALTRNKALDLLYAYSADVTLVYLEQSRVELLRRNARRTSLHLLRRACAQCRDEIRLAQLLEQIGHLHLRDRVAFARRAPAQRRDAIIPRMRSPGVSPS
ncbi:AAA family ATPase [Burkholderia pyrrocinia]|uniref:AAA family ATPase n=1 Tax=Burkholderia pyrrocinia TaxID=60550 RepID=UPI00064C0B75|nr:hypothetical protein ABD05_14440 [Burkholderia pyrrocinia]